jgi:4-amino-4-deoxy-L-arabinose transferase-like glycosyltransferase
MQRAFSALVATPARRTALAVAALVVLVLIPFAGNYGAWDPWETHYGEVARQMLARNDFISLWWPGSPIDHPPLGAFWSKPVLTFWLEALSLKLAGLEWAGARANELVTSWRPEWALRMPSILLAMASIAAVYATVRRLASRRAAVIAAVVLVSSPEWLLIARQAMTDMAFVAPMTIALCLAALAILSPDETPLVRKRWRGLSWPHASAFYGFAALFVVTTAPQLLIDSIALRVRVTPTLILPGLVPMLPYIGCFVGGLWWAARATTRRELYLLTAWLLCALASLAKGPAGLALPAITIAVYLVCAGRWRDIFRLELVRGAVVFIACGIPWWHAMLIRHGRPFWNELIGDNYINRAAGRNGDRGTFEYYLEWIAYGLFPWSGMAAIGTVASFLAPKSVRGALARFALVWVAVDVGTITLVNTKFHHYSLPALPALAILAALFIDDVLTAPRRWHAVALGLFAVPLTFACARDLAAYPPRFLWMFDYDYVLVPGTGRPWPSTTIYGSRYEYGALLWLLGGLATLAVVAFTAFAARGRAVAAPDGDGEGDGAAAGDAAAGDAAARAPTAARVWAAAAAFAIALVVGIAAGPSTPHGAAPIISPWLWLVPAVPMVVAVWLVARSARLGALIPVAVCAVVYGAFLLDRYLPDLGPHWSQKHVIASYYAHRSGPDEPLIVYNLYWRGENFYTRNEIYSQSTPAEKWAWVTPETAANQAWFERHKGHRIFILLERHRLEQVRGILPAGSRAQLKIVDDSNNKLLLVETRI